MTLSVLVAGLTVGCATSEDDVSLGTMTVHLTGQAPSGTVYRLRNAVITVQGAATTEWHTEDDPGRTSLSADVPVGDYTALLHDGWRMERVTPTGAIPVTAHLISDNPAQFTVTAQQRTTVPLEFRVDSETVSMTQGYDVVISVGETPPPLLVVGNQSPSSSLVPSGVEMFAVDAAGAIAPFREIAGNVTTLVSPGGVAIDGGEVFVCDRATNAIVVFPISASGNVSPIRRLAGPTTQISSPISVVVFHGEIFVAQSGPVVVFPRNATGDIAPSRRILNVPNPWFLAIAGSEIYVTSGGPTISVYPLTASGAVPPTRTLTTTGCPTGMTIHGDEIFLTDVCNSPASIQVLPLAASGTVTPRRTIRGTNTGIVSPTPLAVFANELYVGDSAGAAGGAVRVFPLDVNGNVAPTRVVTGQATRLGLVNGVGVF